MASIQINELPMVEAPMEELSYDVACNVNGGLLSGISRLIDKLLGLSDKVFDACESGQISEEQCALWVGF